MTEGAVNSSHVTTNSSWPSGSLSSMPHNHLLAYALLPIGTVLLIGTIGIMVIMIMKKRRLSRLRHHLLPMYHFEAGGEGEDWEEDLLEEERQQQAYLRVQNLTPPDSPRRKLREDLP